MQISLYTCIWLDFGRGWYVLGKFCFFLMGGYPFFRGWIGFGRFWGGLLFGVNGRHDKKRWGIPVSTEIRSGIEGGKWMKWQIVYFIIMGIYEFTTVFLLYFAGGKCMICPLTLLEESLEKKMQLGKFIIGSCNSFLNIKVSWLHDSQFQCLKVLKMRGFESWV